MAFLTASGDCLSRIASMLILAGATLAINAFRQAGGEVSDGVAVRSCGIGLRVAVVAEEAAVGDLAAEAGGLRSIEAGGRSLCTRLGGDWNSSPGVIPGAEPAVDFALEDVNVGLGEAEVGFIVPAFDGELLLGRCVG